MKMLVTMGAFVGSSVGWWVGDQLGGTFMAFVVGMVGTGLGMVAGRRAAQQWLG